MIPASGRAIRPKGPCGENRDCRQRGRTLKIEGNGAGILGLGQPPDLNKGHGHEQPPHDRAERAEPTFRQCSIRAPAPRCSQSMTRMPAKPATIEITRSPVSRSRKIMAASSNNHQWLHVTDCCGVGEGQQPVCARR